MHWSQCVSRSELMHGEMMDGADRADGAGRADGADRSDRSDRADGGTDAPPTAVAVVCASGSRLMGAD